MQRNRWTKDGLVPDTQVQYTLDWVPTHAYVRGLPFMLQGWNTVYQLVVHASGEIEYRLGRYTLYWFIPIIGISIRKIDGRWTLIREDGAIIASKAGAQETPFGEGWDYGMTVVGLNEGGKF
jgi:hypothetical protein